MRVKSQMQYFSEYLFHQVVQEVNDGRAARGEPVIPVSKARTLHTEFIAQLKNKKSSMLNANKNMFTETINDVFAQYNDEKPVFVGAKINYDAGVARFKELTGFNSKSIPKHPVLPLSPYDDRFSGRAVFRKNGSRLLFARGADVDMDEESFGSSLKLYTMTENGRTRFADQAVTLDDLSGMTVLMPYMAQKDYDKVVKWVNDIGTEDDTSRYMSSAALERSRAILEELQNQGTAYTITCDENMGQIRANLTGTKISIRLTDEKIHENYIGRIYDDGRSIYYTTNKKDATNMKLLPYKDMTPEECVKLLHFAQGKSVTREDTKRPVGLVRSYTRKNGLHNEAYHSGADYSAVAGPYPTDSDSRVLIYVKNERKRSSNYFGDEAKAIVYLQDAIASARSNFEVEVDLDGLINAAIEHGEDEDYSPSFSGDKNTAALQQRYWDALVHDAPLDGDYEGSKEEQVRQHWFDYMDSFIGNYELNEDGKRFDPISIASYMTSEFGVPRNNANIVAALRKMDMNPDELIGDSFYNKSLKDKLIRFDPSTAKPMGQHVDPMVQTIFREIKSTINETGCSVNDRDILMDHQGVVHYKAARVRVEKIKSNSKPDIIEGEIGQIFVPDGMGLVETKFASSDNHLFSPGYEAYILPQKEGEDKSVEERTRLKGYTQIMCDSIRYKIRSDVISAGTFVGSPTSVNNVYRRLYDTRYSLDFMQQAHLDGMSDDLLQDILKTNARRVRYSNEIEKQSTINAEYQADTAEDEDPANDNYRDYYQLTGGRNMSIMVADGDGYFDKSATSGSTNQGIVRFLVEGATVEPDGRIIPGDLNDKTPLMKNEVCAFMDYIPFDRQQMTFGNLLKASCVTGSIKTAQMTFGGWNFDDGYVVSKEFAEQYQIRGEGDKLRPLLKGDKISDLNGNKGVISLVVDPDMSEEDAVALGIKEPWAWFHANKGNLDVVGAPFPAMSRFNGGSARELMQNPSDLKNPDGTIYEGCVGEAKYIITHMSVDEKTHIYGDEEVAQGKGRKASSQLAWALAAQGATKVLKECYGSNSGSLSNLREMMITMGLDMDELGNLQPRYKPHVGEDRQIFKAVDLEYRELKDGPDLDAVSMKRKFGDIIARSGGFLEVPFALSYPTGEPLSEIEPDKRRDKDEVSYALPVLSSFLRSGQEFEDGTSSAHDYTNHYLRIYEATIRYRFLKEGMNEDEPDKARAKREKSMSDWQKKAQAEYEKITNDLKIRKFSGKYNMIREGIMANRMPHSATAVWTADPRLDIDQVAMNSDMAKSLGVEEDDYVLVWRDPIIRDTGVRYIRVKIDETLIGTAINPAMDKSYDGDFDGDAVAVVALSSKAAQMEAMEKLSVNSNLLDYGSKNADGEYDLMMQDSLDMKSAAFVNPSLSKRRAAITKRINKMESDALYPRQRMMKRSSFVSELNRYTKDSFKNEYGTDMVSFKDMESHIKSVEHMILDGAKGNYDKLKDYAKYLGVDYELTDDVGDNTSSRIRDVKDMGESLATREDLLAVQYATAVKAFGTAIAGMFSQRGMSVLRNVCPKAVLEVTYPVTQSILQAKHDPEDAKHKYDLLMGTVQELWLGRKLQKIQDENGCHWKTATDEDGRTIQATSDEFKSQFMDIYTSKDGLNVKINENFVNEVCDGLSDHGVMLNLQREAKESYASTMDKLAYGGTFDTLKEAARLQLNLFDGKYNQYFAPRVVWQNQAKSKNVTDDKPLKALVKSDTKVKREKKPDLRMELLLSQSEQTSDNEFE